MQLPRHSSFVVGDLIVCDTVEGILGVGRLVHLCVVLVIALDDALGGGSHQHYMVTSCRHTRVFDAVRLVPCDTLQNVRLRSCRNQICPSVLLDLCTCGKPRLISLHRNKLKYRPPYLLLQSFELLRVRSLGHELQGRLNAYGVR